MTFSVNDKPKSDPPGGDPGAQVCGKRGMTKIRMKQKPEHTEYMWGPKEELEGAEMVVLEVGPEKDCLCLFIGKGLVDVHHEDIEQFMYFDVPGYCCPTCGGEIEWGHACLGATGLAVMPEDSDPKE